MDKFTYIKKDNDVSRRKVQPIGFVFDDRNKVMCLDLSQYEGEELEDMKALASQLHRDFLNSVYDSELAGNFRTFFLDSISEVE